MAGALQDTGLCSPRVLAFVKPDERTGQDAVTLPYTIRKALGRYRGAIADAVNDADVVHVHGLWHPGLLYTAYTALQRRRPLIVSPHGMLDAWALQQKTFKKRLMSWLCQKRLLSSASCIRALTEREKHDAERYSRLKRVEVIPNGVPRAPAIDPCVSEEVLKSGRLVTFLGRLHRKKGVQMLLSVWPEVSAAVPDAVLVLAGPDEEGLACGPLPPRCVPLGTVTPSKRWSLLARSTLFVLPSYSEGFSMAILEALASACPVLISDACNFPDVAAARAGLVIAPEVSTLRDGLIALLKMEPAALREWGQRGKKLAESRYSEAVMAERLATLYQQVCTETKEAVYADG